jgi:hypothetical protein
LRDSSAFVLIIAMNSSMRSGLTSASTMIEKGLDMREVLEEKDRTELEKEGLGAVLNA